MEWREVDRKLFVTLRAATVKVFGHLVEKYFIHNDWNYVAEFYANSDEDAIKEFRDRIEKKELDREKTII